MYKRRLYKQEHADKDELSDSSSSSSSDSESEAEPQQEEREEEENAQEEVDIDSEAPEINGYEKKISCPSSGSGYESEDSSEKEVKYDSSDDDEEIGNDITNFFDGSLTGKGNAEAEVAQINTRTKKDSIETDYSDRILKCKSVYKCRLCPRLVCLTEESLRAHLNSKRHARSEKLLKEGRLKFMLNSDGEIEEDPETHAERHARTLALAQQDSSNKKKKNRGRQRQRLRLKRKKNGDAPEKAKEKEPTKNRTNKKRRKVVD